MSLNYLNLDERTRELMLEEVNFDEERNNLYLSTRLSAQGLSIYPNLLKEAIKNGNDGTLEAALKGLGIFNPTFPRKNPKGGMSNVKMPTNAAQMLAEGEFNRFYIRGLCLRALEKGISEVVGYRAKDVRVPRPESIGIIGKTFDAQKVLEDNRANVGKDTVLGVPLGPNSGLSARLP